MVRHLALMLLIGGAAYCQEKLPNEKFTPPPGEETAEVRALIGRAETSLKAGRTVSEVLGDGTFQPVRAWRRFRALIKDHASDGLTTLVPASEPGDLMHVRGTVRDAQKHPMKGSLIHVYHTSSKGWYSDKAAHISGDSGDVKHARLFAYLKTDAEGRYEFRTIRPAGYPATDLPAHFHVHIDAAGTPAKSYGTEIRFEDDPRMTAAWRKRSQDEGCVICGVKKDGKIQRVEADFQFRD